MQKIINFRPLLNIFLAGLLGALFAYFFIVFNLFNIILVGFILVLYFVLYFIYNKKTYNSIFSNYKFLILFIFVFVLTFLNFNAKINEFESQKLNGENYVIRARITDNIVQNDNSFTVYLEKANIVLGETQTKIKKQIKLNIYMDDDFNEDEIKAGSTVLFTSNIYDYSLLKNNKLNTYVYFNNLGHYANVTTSNIIFYSGAMHFDEHIRQHTKTLLQQNMSYDNANLSYAVLFGDKTLMENSFYEQFRISGIAHILAVSGLHIGFLVALFLYLFTKIKLNKKLQFLLLLILLTFYAFMCNFSPSVVRASLMALTFLLGHLIGERNDNLSNLSLAGAVILIINPINAVAVGFLLSFTSVLGIFLLYPIFTRWFYKIRIPEKIAQMLALTLAAQIGTLPIITLYFGEMNVLSIFTNLIALPLFTFGYMFLFILFILSSIFSFFSFLFIVPQIIFTFVHLIAKLVANLPFGLVSLLAFPSVAILFYYIGLFTVSHFVLLKNKQKIYAVLKVFIIFVTSIILSITPVSYGYDSFTRIDGVSSASLITTQEKHNYLVDIGNANLYDEHNITSYLKQKRIYNLEAIILSNYNEEKQTILCNLVKKYKVNTVYIPITTNNILIFNLFSKLPTATEIVFMENEVIYTHKNLQITNYSFNEVGYLVKVNTTNYQALFCDYAINTQEINQIKNQIIPLTRVLVMDKMTNYIYNVLIQSEFFNELEYILVRNNQITYAQENLYDTITYGYLQVK